MSQPSQRLATALLIVALATGGTRIATAAVSFSGDTSVGVQTIIGNLGYGTFRIDGGSVHSTSSSGTVIGGQSTGIGIATVTGAGSQWVITSSGPLTVGNQGMGRLEVLDGGVVNFFQFGSLSVASSSNSHGTVIVDGSGSLLTTQGLNLGVSGSASLQVSNGGIVNVNSSGLTTSPVGRITLANGLVRAAGLGHSGTLTGSGEFYISSSSLTNNGRIEARAGDLLRITGAGSMVQNQGIIAADGANMEFNGPITTASGSAEITLRNAVLRTGTSLMNQSQPQLTNHGVLATTGGVSDLYGRVLNQNQGRIAVTNKSTLIFHDDVVATSGTIVVFPGSSAVFLEDLQMDEGATLLADLAGTNQDSGFGQIEVVGNAILAGALSVSLSEGYTPQLGDSFPLLAASSISGNFTLGTVPALPSGLAWDLEVDSHRALLSVVPSLDGDYDQNGIVDGADYVLWRKTAAGGSQGYNDWQANFGNTAAGQSAATTAAVPEPTSSALFLSTALLVLACRRKLK